MRDVVKDPVGRLALARKGDEGNAPERAVGPLPEAVIELAKRLGVLDDSGAKLVTLIQSGDMRLGKGVRRTRFRARQTIDLTKTGFAWRASAGPFGSISVCDAYRDGGGELDVRLFNHIRIAHMDGIAIAKGEIMRYLAEIAWAPDAIMLNHSLDWSVTDKKTLWVTAGSGAGRGSVRLDLDDEGRIGFIFAPDRPYSNGKLIEERPWSGRFFDYRRHDGRWIPFSAEVGWLVDGQTSNYFRCTLASWTVA